VNASLRRRLFVWVGAGILAVGLLAAALSFAIEYDQAHKLQDRQLTEVAAVLSRNPLPTTTLSFEPKAHGDSVTHLVIKRLGTTAPDIDAGTGLAMAEPLRPGLQTIEQGEVQWRAIVSEDSAGQRFAVAQRVAQRDELALQVATMTLPPLLLSIPLLLLIVNGVMARAFAPMTAMSAEVDRLDGSQLGPLDERTIPLEALPLVQAINRMMRRLAGVLEQQRRLVSDAAHELRTPVAALIVQADNVQHVSLPPEAAARMASLRQGLTRISSLIDQLLHFARLQGGAPATTQRLDLDALVRLAIEDVLPMAQAKRIDLGCPRIDEAAIHGDPLHFQALVRNAVDNAVRYTPPGGSVDVSVVAEGGEVCLVVEDTGPGIAREDLKRVFEPFVRVLGSDQSGSGLGLAIARTAAQALGGRIELGERGDRHSGLRFTYRQMQA
jgi:two-component system, OmpR family, sensor kinase